MKRLLGLFVVLCLSITMFSCSNNTPEEKKDTSFSVVDQSGREVTFDKPADKVASGYYIATSTIIGLGAKDKLVGVEMKAETREIYHQAAPEVLKLAALGNKKMFNVEECAKADPDVVFLPISLQSYVGQLEELDIKVILLEPETKKGFNEAVEIIAKVCGKEKKANEYFAYVDSLNKKYMDSTKAVENSKRVYFAGSELLQAASKSMFQSEIINDAKGVNAIIEEAQSSWISINMETLLAADPSYIFLENGGVNSDEVYANTALSELEAVKNKQVYVFPSTLETWDTPNLSYCLGMLWSYAILNPEDVSMDDVKKEASYFYKTFYDIDVEEFGF